MILPSVKETQLLTGRLRLRPPRKQDYAAWADGRTESRAHLEPWEPRWSTDALSRDDWTRRLKAWRAAWQDDRAYVFLIFTLEKNQLAGGVSLTNVRRGPAQSASVGYWLLRPFERQGLMAEALSAVCKWSRDTICLCRLEAGTLPENEKSQGVLRRCHFVEEGRATAFLEINGQRRDHILYGLNLADLPE